MKFVELILKRFLKNSDGMLVFLRIDFFLCKKEIEDN